MGWASYFEDIQSRYYGAESRVYIGGPASSSCPTPIPAPARSIPDPAIVMLERMREINANLQWIYSDLAHTSRAGQWTDLSQCMDKFALEVDSFSLKSLFAASSTVLDLAQSLVVRINAILRRSRGVERHVSAQMKSAEDALKALQALKNSFPLTPTVEAEFDIDLERRVLQRLADGREFLQRQISDLDMKSEELQVRLAEVASSRLVLHWVGSYGIQNKD